MKLRNWLKGDKEEQAENPVEVGGLELDGDGEVLESGFNLQDFEHDIEGRKEAIDQLERDVSRHQKKKKRAVQKARKADTETDKKGFMVEAKQHKVAKQKKEKVLDHLRKEKQVLNQLKLQHLQNNIGSAIGEDLDINVGELSASEIESAIEEGADELWEASENMEDLDEAMALADEELAGLDLSEIENEVHGDSSNDIDLENAPLQTEEDIDRAIDETLQEMDEKI